MAKGNHASYGVIGFTICAGLAAIVGALVYLGGMKGRGSEIFVETYYDKPVSGLSVGSDVNFRGVKIGEVREIGFVDGHYKVEGRDRSRIYILMAVKGDVIGRGDQTTEEVEDMIRRLVDRLCLRATVTASGITGLSRIEWDFAREELLSETPKISWTPRNTYIPPKISLLDNFSDSATKVMNQINKMDLNAVWSNVSASVESLARATDAAKTVIETRQGDIERILDDLTATTAAIRDLAAELKRNPSLLLRERKPARLDETE